ncbi:hypothetical protein FSP39_018633 [Pinctada imbricata]|uniref:Nuclear pore complex protein Nup205-like protein n=1 Tax=Pinctada imbricata TaxID=66713 RepID=A0AA88YK00_PINIB|nr:hypothetical protein FSP39_018633 [Pinctada imbricata]
MKISCTILPQELNANDQQKYPPLISLYLTRKRWEGVGVIEGCLHQAPVNTMKSGVYCHLGPWLDYDVFYVEMQARLWGLYKELEQTVNAAIHKKLPDAAHDLEVALRKHKPDFVSLLKNPAKNAMYRDSVKKSTTVGLPVQGEQVTQTFSQQFIDESIIISDLFDMSEIAAVELLMAGERKQAEFPGLTRGLVAVLLYYDGQRSLVNSLRTLLQSRVGRMWTMELSPELSDMVNKYTDQLISKDGLINKILDLIANMDVTKEMDKLQKERAIGPPKHRKQLTDIYKEIKQILADCLFCLASQQPLGKSDTLRLLSHLRTDNSVSADGSIDLVTLCLLMAVLYSFDVSILEESNGPETVRNLPLMSENGYVTEIHKELMSSSQWANPGLKAVLQFAWALTLRQLSQYETPTDVSEICEVDEDVVNMALDANVFHFIRNSVVAVPDFHQEEYYLKKIHGLITDFIHIMPLRVKDLRTRGDESARIASSQTQDGIEIIVSPSRGFEYLLLLIGDLYGKDPLGLNLSLEFWYPQESSMQHESMYHSKTPQRQVELYKFIRLAGDLNQPMMLIPYIRSLIGLSSNPLAAHHCYDLLKTNGLSTGGPATLASWNHFFASLHQYYSSLRYERPTGGDITHRAPMVRGITPHELDGLLCVLQITRTVAEQNENCRVAIYENQQWSAVMMMFGLVTCSIPPLLKAEIFLTLAAFAKSPDLAANLWPSLEGSQILPTIRTSATKPAGGIKVELDEIESRLEEYCMTRAFLTLLNAMTDVPVPAGLGVGSRAPGFQPYLEFILDDVFLKSYTRGYKDIREKWQVAVGALEILCKLLREHELVAEDFVDELVELQGGGVVPLNKSSGHVLLTHMLKDSGLLRMVLRILDESISLLESYVPIQGKEHLDKVSLLCLRLVEYTLEKADQFLDAVRDTGSSLVVFPMDRLLLGINPRSGKADHLLNIAKYIEFSLLLPDHALSSMKILYSVCRSSSVQSALINLFTAEENTRLELIHGFVECLEVDDPETPVNKTIYMPEEKEELTSSQVHSSTREYLLQILLLSLEQPAPNLAHFLLGFELRKPVSKTNLQDPGILRSPKTCLHAILTILMSGVGTHSGPDCLTSTPRLAELSYKLLYLLAANKDTSAPTLRYLRSSRDFLYRQLHHLPFRKQQNKSSITSSQSWLMKVVSIELRLTSLNRQRSHTQRLMRLLLDDTSSDQTSTVPQPGMPDDCDLTMDRFGESLQGQSFLSSGRGPIKGIPFYSK